MAAKSAFQIAIDIFASPNEAFRAIREKPKLLLPVLLVPLLASIAYGYYFLGVDIGWVTEQQLRQITFIELTEAQIEQQVEAAVERGPALSVVQSSLGAFFSVLLFMLLQALYLRIVTMFTKDGNTYGKWFGVAAWASMPSVFSSIATIVFVYMNDVSFVAQTQVNPLTFGNLLAFDASDDPLYLRAFMAMSPDNLWSIVLAILGYRIVAGRGYVFSSLVILAPLAFVVAIIFAIS